MVDMAKRRLTYEHRIPSRSVEPIRAVFDAAIARHQRGRRLLTGSRKLTAESVINAILLAWLNLSEEDQFAVLRQWVPMFDRLAADPECEPVVIVGTEVGPGQNKPAPAPARVIAELRPPGQTPERARARKKG